jgi:cation diffusion facilitator CzcD-associated flavoprotein CzcO
MEHLSHKYVLRPRISLCTSLELAEWDEVAQVYRLTLMDVRTGKVWKEDAEVVVSATGALSTPVFPRNVGGREEFRGESWHSAEWRHDVTLTGKRVGVIGNGCSA